MLCLLRQVQGYAVMLALVLTPTAEMPPIAAARWAALAIQNRSAAGFAAPLGAAVLRLALAQVLRSLLQIVLLTALPESDEQTDSDKKQPRALAQPLCQACQPPVLMYPRAQHCPALRVRPAKPCSATLFAQPRATPRAPTQYRAALLLALY